MAPFPHECSIGIENLNAKAGLQGFPSSLMENTIGLPTVSIAAFSGFSYPQQVPSSFKRELFSGTANLNLIRDKHTITLGAEYTDRRKQPRRKINPGWPRLSSHWN